MSDTKEFKLPQSRCHLPIIAIFGLVAMGLVVGFVVGLGIRTTIYEDRTIARSYSEPEPTTQPATAEIESPSSRPSVAAAMEPVESPSENTSVRQVNLQGR